MKFRNNDQVKNFSLRLDDDMKFKDKFYMHTRDELIKMIIIKS